MTTKCLRCGDDMEGVGVIVVRICIDCIHAESAAKASEKNAHKLAWRDVQPLIDDFPEIPLFKEEK